VREHPLASGRPRIGVQGTLTTLFLLLVIGWAWSGTNVSIGELVTSAPNMWDLITRMVPPDWAFFTSYDHVIEPTLVTIQLAITSTVIAVGLAFPISMLAARNLSHPALYQSIRVVLNIIRSIPELVWALIFVSAVGLGPFAGTLALVMGSVGSLSKIFAESIEAINPKPVEAMDAVGATASQRIAFAVIPQALVSMISYALLYWEHNIRASFIVGAVGTSYSAVIEAQRAKKVDLAFYGPFSYILGHEEANAQALIQGETKDGQLATYTGLIITPADSPLTSLADIKGKTFSFVDPASTSGHLVPCYTLLQKAGLHETDYKPIYAGSHPASYQAVVNKKVDAGAIASDTFAKGIKEGSIDDKKVKILDTSFPIPGSPIAVRGDIQQADQDMLLQAFLAINDQPKDSKLYQLVIGTLGVGAVKIIKADDHAYDELRKIPAAIGIDIKGLVK
jgi:phosphonate ABC transporter permease subunit PhnE